MFRPGVKRRMQLALASLPGRLCAAAPSQARIKARLRESAVMKLLLAIAVTVLLCAACAQGGAASSGAGSGSIDMYGTIDEGISYHK
jgi:hypothetical protein